MVKAKETILSSSPLQECSPLSPKCKAELLDEPFDRPKYLGIHQSQTSNQMSKRQIGINRITKLNAHVKDFLEFEDSSDSDLCMVQQAHEEKVYSPKVAAIST